MRDCAVFVGPDIRRDFIQPLGAFQHLSVAVLYRNEPYRDLEAADRGPMLYRFAGVRDLARQLERLRPAYILGVEPFALRLLPWALVCDWMARRLKAVRCPIALENRPLREKYSPLIAALAWPFIGLSVRRSQALYALNAGAVRNLRWAGAPPAAIRRQMVGTWGVDLSEFTPRPDGREPTWPGEPVVLFVGRLHAEKGILDLADGFGRLREHAPNAQLVVVGHGPHEAELRAAVRSFAGSVHFLGTVKNASLPPIFRSATLFVSPSRVTCKWEEQVGMTNIQAMACGVPIVSTHTGAIPEYVPDGIGGLLVPERDPSALSEAMRQIVKSPDLWLSLARTGRAYAEAHYDAYRNVRRFEESLLSLRA
jgi:glycosyltransferase involved in cell wall biosynthesis